MLGILQIPFTTEFKAPVKTFHVKSFPETYVLFYFPVMLANGLIEGTYLKSLIIIVLGKDLKLLKCSRTRIETIEMIEDLKL